MIVCSCHRVTDRDVQAACAAGARRIGAVVRATCAGTDCGGCIPQLRRVVAEACELDPPRVELATVTAIAV